MEHHSLTDLEDARERAEAALRRVRRADARRAVFLAAVDEVAASPDPEGGWTRALGLPRSTFGPGLAAYARRLRRAFEAGAARPPGDAPTVVWVAAEECAGPGAFAALVAEELGAGHVVVALVPPALRSPLEALAAALEQAAAQAGRRGAGLVVPCVSDAGPGAALARVARLGDGALGRLVAAVRASRAHALAEEQLGPLVLHALRAATVVVGERDDPARSARRVARLAFGADAAGGFLATAVGAVWVHPRRFAEFHSELLHALEGGPRAPEVPPLACGLVPEFRASFEVVHRLGLDEGATLIHAAGHAAARPLGAGGRGPGAPLRAVFTNVDPGLRLVRELEPAGVLRVLRVAAPRAAEGARAQATEGETPN